MQEKKKGQHIDGRMVLRQSKKMVASEKKVVRLGGKKPDSIHEALVLHHDVLKHLGKHILFAKVLNVSKFSA